MDRRTFVMTGAWLSAAGCVAPWFAHAARTPGVIAVFDSDLAPGNAFRDYVARAGMPVFEIGDDASTLWFTTLAPRLTRAPGVLVGLARASDFFVLEQLATRSGRTVHTVRQEKSGGAAFVAAPLASVAFLIGPPTV